MDVFKHFCNEGVNCALRHKKIWPILVGVLQTHYEIAALAGNRRAVIVPSLADAR